MLCKFEGKSAGYRTVAAALLRYVREAPDVIPRRWSLALEVDCPQQIPLWLSTPTCRPLRTPLTTSIPLHIRHFPFPAPRTYTNSMNDQVIYHGMELPFTTSCKLVVSAPLR